MLSPKGRQLLIDRIEKEGQKVQDVAESLGVSERTARKWLARYRAEGPDGLFDRSSAPQCRGQPHRCSDRAAADGAAAPALHGARARRPAGPAVLDDQWRCSSAIGMGKLGRIGQEPALRYERARPGELIHVDVKKLGRIHGGCRQTRHRRTQAQPSPAATRRGRRSTA